MKPVFKLLCIILLAHAVSSCKNDPIVFNKSDIYVGFDRPSISIPEEELSSEIPVMIGGLESGRTVTVQYEVSVEGIDRPAIEGVDFTIGSADAVDFPNGAGYSNITVHPVDNNQFTGNKSFRIIITSNSANYPIGRENSILVVIKDDEHPLKKWIGNYNVNAVSYYNPGPYDETWTVTTEADPNHVDKLLIYGVGTAGSGPLTATLNLDEMTITLEPGQSIGDAYSYGNISIFKGTDDGSSVIEDEPITGVISDDGTIYIDLWGEVITDGTYAGGLWDVFNTTWTKQ